LPQLSTLNIRWPDLAYFNLVIVEFVIGIALDPRGDFPAVKNQ
jgi:hypothetical protein